MAKLTANASPADAARESIKSGGGTSKVLAKQRTPGYILVVGPQEAGKTTASLMVDPAFDRARLTMTPEELAKQPIIELPTVCHVSVDTGAEDPLLAWRMNTDSYNPLPVIEDLGPHGIKLFCQNSRQFFSEWLKPEHKFIVIDTLSAFDDMISGYWATNTPTTQGNNDNTQKMWQQIKGSHNQLRNGLLMAAAGAGVTVIIICHATVEFNAMQDGKTLAAQNAVTGKVGRVHVELALTGSARDITKRGASLVLTCKKVPDGNKEKRILTSDDDDWPGKSRMSQAIGTEFPADLGYVLTKWSNWRELP